MTPRTLAPHLLRTLAAAHRAGRSPSLEALCRELGVRRPDVRHAVSALHHAGYLDATRMRLTLSGFALGQALLGRELPALRRPARDVRFVRAA